MRIWIIQLIIFNEFSVQIVHSVLEAEESADHRDLKFWFFALEPKRAIEPSDSDQDRGSHDPCEDDQIPINQPLVGVFELERRPKK